MMSQIWVKYIKINRLKWAGNFIKRGKAIPVTGRGGS
jgi:hypothetical protein